MFGGQEGYHTLDPEQDGHDPISVFCNMSSTPVTAVLHHNREEWTYVSGYEAPGSYNGKVSCIACWTCSWPYINTVAIS